jgi:DeoR/GlpR family transcriptional regulator of sugar metabolism
MKIQRRRQRLIALWNTAKHFTPGKASESLGVSRWTVARDLAFLRDHELLTPKRSLVCPFELLESGSEFCARFTKAHQTSK